MIKKIITLAIPIFLISIILFISYKSYNQATNTSKNPLNIIPTNASVILKFNNTKSIYNELNSKKIWNNLLNINIIDSLNSQLKKTSKLFEDKENIFLNQILYLSIHRIGADNTGVLFASNFDNKKHEVKSIITKLFGNIQSTIKYDKQIIYKIEQKKSILYASHYQDIIFYSFNKILIEDAIRVSNSSDNLLTINEFKNIYKTISNSASINLFINYNSLIQHLNIFSNKSTDFNLCEWSANDLNIRQNIITANGFNLFSNKNYTSLIKDQLPESSNITKIIPNSTSLLLTIGYNNSTNLYEKKNSLLQQNNQLWSWNKNRKLIKETYNLDYNDFIKELEGETGTFSTSLTQNEKQSYTFFKSKNPIIAISQLQALITKTKEYSSYSISQISDPNITANLFGDVFLNKNPFFTIIDDYFIFGTSMSSIEYIIDNYKRKNTLDNNKYFDDYKYYLSKKSNILFYVNPENIAQSFIQDLKKPYKESINYISDSIAKLTGFSIQMNTKKELLLNNITLLYDESYKESIKEKWIKELDTLINMKPQFVENHATKEKFIITQDKNNKIVAINNLGQELWDVQLNSPILNNISVIDVYNNNKFQYLFNTKDQIYIIDRNGENVDGFPISLKTDFKFGHALFDYRKNKRYRILLVGKDNNIYNLDKKGKKVKGWKYIKDNIAITSYPKYFSIIDKDYILIDKNNGNTKLLAINGSERLTYEENQQFNANPVQFDSNGTLYAITKEGKLWQGVIDGNTSTISLPNLTKSSILIQSELNLVDSVKNKTLELLFYTNNNKLYIVNIEKFKLIKEITFDDKIQKVEINNNLLCVTTSNLLYIYNNMKIIEGFPIESNGFFNIGDFKNTGKLNLIESKNGFLYNYELSIE